MRLSPSVINTRMQEWRNLKVLHAKQDKRIERLERENKALRAENVQLKATIAAQATTIQTLQLQMEELRTIVFGKKKKHTEDGGDEDLPPLIEHVGQPRTPESYKRPLPKSEEITKRERHALATCPKGHALTKRTTCIFYTHNIPAVVKAEIEKHIVESGYCAQCKRSFSGIPLPPAAVTFGPRIKRMVAVLSTIHRLSHPQIQLLLRLHFNTTVSDGEVAKMLAQEAEKLRPEQERLKSSIQISSIRHIDESSWEVCLDDGQGKFCWIMADGLSPDRIYELGKSRGKGVADDLLGDNDNTVVSDDYAAYQKRKNHQLCFAHPARDLRDLAHSPSLEKDITAHCQIGRAHV